MLNFLRNTYAVLRREMCIRDRLPTVLSNLTLVLAIKHIGSTMTSILCSMEPLTARCV